MWMAKAPVSMVMTAEYRRITSKYGERGVRYAMIEAGHVAQNIFLQAEALGMGAGIVGAFHDNEVIQVMKIPLSHEPLIIMPVGYKN
jgi:SagB-type dehydrogenase family enzyme